MRQDKSIFVEWEEHVISLDKGNRVVHYYLKVSSGDLVLAVVGTERSLRHMVYVVSGEFTQAYGCTWSINPFTKWRARREVVEWLNWMVSKHGPLSALSDSRKNELAQSLGSKKFSMTEFTNLQSHAPDQVVQTPRILNSKKSDIMWSSDAWISCKLLKRFPTFQWKGTNIRPKSKKCRSGEAEKEDCTMGTSKTKPTYGQLKIKLSRKGNIGIKLVESKAKPKPEVLSVKIGEKIEVLCQDSGIRGCWFRCKVLRTSRKRLKVHYEDVEDVEEPGNIEEWVPEFRIAAPDKLEMRCPGRFMIRPWPPEDTSDCWFEVGAPVDAWWGNGWWEGVVVGTNIFGSDNLRVYLPGENRFLTLQRKYVRSSRDWVNDKWVRVKSKPGILSVISSNVSPQVKLPSCITSKLKIVKEEKHELPAPIKAEALETVEGINCNKKRRRSNKDDN